MSKEIIINTNAIRNAEVKLIKLRQRVNKQLSYNTHESKGSSRDELMLLAQELEQTRRALELLYGNTEKALKNTRNSFIKADNTIANYFDDL